MQRLNWNDIQDFLTVARAGRLARAGAAIGVDATTIGRHVRRLERKLGQILFEQTRDGHVLTPAGEELLIQAETMEQAASRIADTPNDGTSLAGLLRISVSEGFGTWYAARRIAGFASLHPELVVDLVASSGFLNPSRRETDVAIMLDRPTTGPLVSVKLTDYELGIYATRDYLERNGTPIDAARLGAPHRLIGYVPELLYAPQLNYLDEISPGLEATLRSTSINAQYRLVTAGAGIGVLPYFIGRGDPALVRILPERRVVRSFWMVTHRDTRELRRVRAFQSWLADAVARDRDIFIPPSRHHETSWVS